MEFHQWRATHGSSGSRGHGTVEGRAVALRKQRKKGRSGCIPEMSRGWLSVCSQALALR